MATDTEVEKIVDEIMEKHNQSDDVKKRFLRFYENTINNNLGDDLHGLIKTVELSVEEELDGS